jgi:hypothetical protein
MSTIPASAIVNVIPNVLNAGGDELQLLGICVTENVIAGTAAPRVPIGEDLSFPSAAAVASFFGASAKEATLASVYFAGYDNKTAIPAAMLFASFPGAGVAASLRGGDAASLSLAQLKALSGSLTIVVDGYTFADASFALSAATSFSSAAAIIQTALNGTLPAAASVTGSIAPETSAFTASIAGNIMTVTAVASGLLVPGEVVAGSGVTAGTEITSQLSGTANGVGTYAVSIAQTVASESLTGSYGLLTVTAVGSGSLTPGQTLSGSGVTASTLLTGYGTGAGLTGTYYVNLTQTASSTTITADGTALAVSFDSVSGGFIISSGQAGATSTIAYATGTLAASLFLTQATGAVLSQGSAAQLPGTFMNGIVAQTQNWASFFLAFDPDGGSGNTQKLLFSAWVNSTQNRYAFVCWDTDITPTESTDAASSMGQILLAEESSGTILCYQPSDLYIAPFVAGMIASIDFAAANGAITFMGKHQQGLVAGVTNQTVSANLDANGYNYYGAYATANQGFVFFNKGQISGEFDWANTYCEQIWLNNEFQLALMEFLTAVNSVPYNAAGYAMIEAACLDVITQALNNGVIRLGVTLSSNEVLEINNTAGANVAPTVQSQGWYFQVQDATPQVRAARTTPPIFFWYTDGGSVQQITLNSIDVQ